MGEANWVRILYLSGSQAATSSRTCTVVLWDKPDGSNLSPVRHALMFWPPAFNGYQGPMPVDPGLPVAAVAQR